MSKTESKPEQIWCEACGEKATLKRGKYRKLKVSCACEDRDVKVSKATPLEWEP